MTERSLKLGILLDSFHVPAWAYHSLERIVCSDCAEIALIVLNDREDVFQSRFERLWRNRHTIVYSVFDRIDRRLFFAKPDAFQLRDLVEMLPYVPVIAVNPVQNGDSHHFAPEDVDRITQYGLDILIKLGFGNLRGDILTAAKSGTWAYRHGDHRINAGGPPGFWEVVESWPETGCGLYVLGEDLRDAKVLYRSWLATYPFSPARNRHYSFWASTSFLSRRIELLYRLGEKRFLGLTARFHQEFDFYDGKPYQTPSNMLALGLIARLLVKICSEIYHRLFCLPTWHLMFDLGEDPPASFYKFREILPPKDRFWADPHVIRTESNYYVFVEEYIYRTGKGHISVIEMDERGDHRDPVRVLEKDYHLSYPFVFEWDDKYLMVPESAANRSVDLYECVVFPHKWQFNMTLMKNVRAFDTTLFYYGEKWWLFTAMAEHEGSFPQVELFLFFSSELFTTEWTPHPFNPIVSKVTRARPAGKLFVRKGKIYRPSQDSSKMYGYGFDLNEILCLSETEYVEKKVISVRPDWDKRTQGTHTYTSEGQLTIIDAFTRRRKLL